MSMCGSALPLISRLPQSHFPQQEPILPDRKLGQLLWALALLCGQILGVWGCGDNTTPLPLDLKPTTADQGPGKDLSQGDRSQANDAGLGDTARTDMHRIDQGPGNDSRADDAHTSDSNLNDNDQMISVDALMTGDAVASDSGVPDDASPGNDMAPLDDTIVSVDGPIIIPFACYGLTPEAGNNSQAVEMALDGDSFEAAPTVQLVDAFNGQTIDLGAAAASDRDGDQVLDQAQIAVPIGTPQGMYSVMITNTSAGESRFCGTYLSTTAVAPTITAVVPDTAWAGDPTDQILSDQPITITGTGFTAVPSVRFVSVSNPSLMFQAVSVSFISNSSLTSVCPSESQVMPVGDYYVEVVNPNLLGARWMLPSGDPGIFKVTPTPPPVIDSVDPFKVPVNAGGGQPLLDVLVTGDFFHADTKVSLLLPDGSSVDLTSQSVFTIVPAGKDSITISIGPADYGLQVGYYPLRVENPDGQFDTYYYIQVETAKEGRLNEDTWVKIADLIYPRERHASVEGFDVFGKSYIYTVGGTSLPVSGDLNTRPRPVLSNVEILEVNLLGQPAQETQVAVQLNSSLDLSTVDPKHDTIRTETDMATPRSGLTVVRGGQFIYALGGAASDTFNSTPAPALQSMERARILGFETRPNLSLPKVQNVSKGLPLGTWYYRVSAVVAGEGESLASREVAAINSSGQITLRWLPVPGATAYLIYRSLASDGRANTTRLIAAGVNAISFVDDGQGALAPAPGRLRGKVNTGGALAPGDWTYRVSATVAGQSETLAGYQLTMTTAAGDQTIQLAWDTIPNATYNVYRTEIVNSVGETFLLAEGLTSPTYEDAGVPVVLSNPAPEGTAPLPNGSLTTWQLLPPLLNEAREGLDAVLIKAVDGNTNTTDEPFYIFAVGGRSSNALGVEYSKTAERLAVNPTSGEVGATWEILNKPGTSDPVLLNHARAFFPLLSTQGRYQIPVAPPPEVPPCPDNDGDGFTGCSCGGQDCDDNNETVYPGAPEICGDGIDQNCDSGCAVGVDLECSDCQTPDADGDGFNRPQCGGEDCDDSDPTICPDSTQCPDECGDGVDQDCQGGDLSCDCLDPDGDNDGFSRPECGGYDCNDNDPSICPDPLQCIEVVCDGIDQNCDGFDLCNPDASFFSLFIMGGSSSIAVPARAALEPSAAFCSPDFPWSMTRQTIPIPDDPVYLAIMVGDNAFASSGSNSGQRTAEVAFVRPDGTLSNWTVQTELILGGGIYIHGNDGVLYSDFSFSFMGVLHEDLGADPAIFNNARRWEINNAAADLWLLPTEDPPTNLLVSCEPADAAMDIDAIPRAYLSTTRLNAYIFAVAGNGGPGIGPLTSILRIKQ